MRIYRFVSAALSGVLMAGASTAAFAGNFGPSNVMRYEGVPSAACNQPVRPRPVLQARPVFAAPAPVIRCNPGVATYHGPADRLAPVGVYGNVPYGYLKTFAYKNTPNVNIMRMHSRAPLVGGCNPASTGYACRPAPGRPVKVILNAPVQPRVTIAPRYNASAYTPRTYGSTAFVPGIAHIPTSIVDRSPITHIDGIPQPQIRSVTTASGYSSAHSRQTMSVRPAPVMAPARPHMAGGNVLGHVVAGSYSYQPPGGGEAYWEKTSGPTIVGGLPATQILCRRQKPRPARVNVKVVRPVIGVPQPVPTPVPYCAPAPMPRMAGPLLAGPAPSAAGRYGSRWTY